jgi:eukaryotic-like serine/threonine-protein kinase
MYLSRRSSPAWFDTTRPSLVRSRSRLALRGRAPESDAAEPLIGHVLQDRYRVLERLGSGSAGVVYLAEHVRIRRRVAVKLLHSQLTAAEEFVTRFHREAQVAALVASEHVVDVIDMGRLAEGPYFLVMELLQGTDVARVVAAEGALPIARAAAIGLQICDALAAVHRAGIVHRDLKPEHVALVTRSGASDFVKLLDFGLCKIASSGTVTGAGVALGTPRFMAPEQLEGADADPRVDLYALGGVLFFMLAGREPFVARSLLELLLQVWRDRPPRVGSLRPGVPETLETLIDRALDKSPAARPRLDEFRRTLEVFAPA